MSERMSLPKPHPARFCEPGTQGKIRCVLCPHECLIPEGGDGICRVRGVRNGVLVSHVYGRPATVVSDEIEKKPFYHFHPGTRALSLGTLGCNVLCAGCQNWQISHAGMSKAEAEKLPHLSPAKAIGLARTHKLAGVVFTYNEPVVWLEYVRDVAAVFKKAGLYTACVTAGYMTSAALTEAASCVDAFKFDLKGADAGQYARLTKVKDQEPCLRRAVEAKEVHRCHVEIVTNIVPGLNDDDKSLEAMAQWVKDALGSRTPWHVTRFLPDFELSYLPATPLPVLDRAVKIGKKVGLDFVYVSNIPDHAARHTVCPACGRTVIQRDQPDVRVHSVREGRCAFCGEDLNVIE